MAGDDLPQHLRVQHADAQAPACRRVRAGPGVADGGEPGDDRPPVDDEAVDAVEHPGHRQNAGQRLAVEPVRLERAGAHHPVEAVDVAQGLERGVAGEP